MKINQMKFQNIVVKSVFLFAALSVFYTLIFASQLYIFESDYVVIFLEDVEIGSQLYRAVQPFNKLLFPLTIGYLFCGISLYVFMTQSRRNYYLSNYIVIGITTVCGIALSVYALINIFSYMSTYMTIDISAINQYIDERYPALMKSTAFPWSFIIGIIVFIGNIILCGLMTFNAFWKAKVMKQEKIDFAEIDAEIYARWAKQEEELNREADKYES